MLIHGFAKVFEGQFPFPPLDALNETYANSSPMGLLWRFMGFSKSYSVFAGIGELFELVREPRTMAMGLIFIRNNLKL